MRKLAGVLGYLTAGSAIALTLMCYKIGAPYGLVASCAVVSLMIGVLYDPPFGK